jgi:hypothetical protein
MSDTIVEHVRGWYRENHQALLGSYEYVTLNVHEPEDHVRGQIAIQLDGPLVGATLSFWNNGDVMAIGIDKINKREFSFDDRVMDRTEHVTALLNSYIARMMDLTGGHPSL